LEGEERKLHFYGGMAALLLFDLYFIVNHQLPLPFAYSDTNENGKVTCGYASITL